MRAWAYCVIVWALVACGDGLVVADKEVPNPGGDIIHDRPSKETA